MYIQHGKTLKDIYILAKTDPIVQAGLTMYEQNVGTLPMFDVLVTMVCALAEQNATLMQQAIRIAERAPVPYMPFVPFDHEGKE